MIETPGSLTPAEMATRRTRAAKMLASPAARARIAADRARTPREQR